MEIDLQRYARVELPTMYQQQIALSNYSRWSEDHKRRETWPETVCRYTNFMVNQADKCGLKIPPDLQTELFEAILNLHVMPSMRCMMTAGPALERDNVAGYNCAYVQVNRVQAFDEAAFILMCGTGVGFSVERQYINELPDLPPDLHPTDSVIVVSDSRIGWATSIRQLFSMLYSGVVPKWDLSRIRPKGARLKTFGGRASGPEPLEDFFKLLVSVFQSAVQANQRKLNSLQCHSLMTKIGDIVVAGGVRRSALISLSNPSDDRMRLAKSGKWWETNPHFALANNSAAWTEKPDSEIFLEEWLSLVRSKSGERGIFNRQAARLAAGRSGRRDTNYDFGCNPCFSGDTLVAVADGRNAVSIQQLAEDAVRFPVYSARSGVWRNQTSAGLRKDKPWVTEIKWARAFRTGVRPVVEVQLSNGAVIRCTAEHRLALATGGWVAARDAVGHSLAQFFTIKHKNYRLVNSVSNAASYQHRMLWEFHHGPTPAGFAVDHVLPNGDDSEENLQLMEHLEHNKKTSAERRGLANPVHKISDRNAWRQRMSARHFGSGNPRFSGISNEQIISLAVQLDNEGIPITHTNLRALDQRVPWHFSQIRFDGNIKNLRAIVWGETEYQAPLAPQYPIRESHQVVQPEQVTVIAVTTGEVVPVYDLEVEENHNFYIILDGDSSFVQSTGVLVHNCGEIILRDRQFCNLSEVVVRSGDSLEILRRKVVLATILGTLQATLTNFRYLSAKWKENTEEERLLGVSLTGVMDHKVFSGQAGIEQLAEHLDVLRETAIGANKEWAQKLGIPSSTAITCIKPSGNTSQLVDAASGIHPRFAPYYVRTIRANTTDPVAQLMKDAGVPCEDDCNRPGWVFSFPQMAPPNGGLFRRDLSALEHLGLWLVYQEHWCEHKPSITVAVRGSEWLEVGAFVYKHFDLMSGVAFLPFTDHVYRQAPYQEITEEEYHRLASQMPQIDWSRIVEYEKQDTTTSAREFACVGNTSCEVGEI